MLLLAGCSELPGTYEAQLADYLSGTGATIYGAYWCPHSAMQKDYFGGSADRLPYVECDAQGLDAQPELCAEMGIDQYPTWIIGGEYYLGAHRPGKLAVLSGFEAPVDEGLTEESSEKIFRRTSIRRFKLAERRLLRSAMRRDES